MSEHQALKSVLAYFERGSSGELLVGGRSCEAIAREIGTPFYAYDLNVCRAKYRKLRQALPAEVDIHYAIKANPHPEVVRCFVDLGVGFDVASEGELSLAKGLGAPMADTGFAGPGKREDEIRAACEAGIGSLNAECEEELELADRVAGDCGKPLNVSLRVNPAYELMGSGMKMGGGPKQFGIDQEEIPNVLSRFSEWKHLDFKGFHIFAGSQNLKHEAIVAVFEKALDAVISFLPHCPGPPSVVNLGGGFGIPYFSSDTELNITAVGEGLKETLVERSDYLDGVRLAVESGRYLVGESGVYVSKVLYRKRSRGEIFLVIDGGMHQHLAASGNFGQVIKRNYPIGLTRKIDGVPQETVNVVGPLCTPLDRIGTKVSLPKTQTDDLLVVFCSGAYGYTASPRSFLGHPDPAEVTI